MTDCNNELHCNSHKQWHSGTVTSVAAIDLEGLQLYTELSLLSL